MNLRYSDIAAILEKLQQEAMEKNYFANSVDELIEYLEDHDDSEIHIVQHDGRAK